APSLWPVPLPAIHVRLWPAIALRQRPPSSLPRLSSLGCGRVRPLAWRSRPRDWTASLAAALVRRQLGPPLAEWLEGIPKLGLGGSLVEGRVDVRDDERLHGRREALELARLVLHRIREREVERVEESDRALAHRHDQLRLNDVQFAGQERPRLVLVAVRELEAVR